MKFIQSKILGSPLNLCSSTQIETFCGKGYPGQSIFITEQNGLIVTIRYAKGWKDPQYFRGFGINTFINEMNDIFNYIFENRCRL
jgi:hypothetical protein